MTVRSAGILLYRLGGTSRPSSAPPQTSAREDGSASPLEVWIAHMGGPFWAGKDARAWSVPKGEYPAGEDPLEAAHREFAEEIGTPAPAADYLRLGDFRQPSGKVITVYAAESDFQPDRIVSNTFTLEWPKGSGAVRSFPEIDQAEWATEEQARVRLVKGQLPILDALLRHLGLGAARGALEAIAQDPSLAGHAWDPPGEPSRQS
jgi:predicted NUDIX family NTP pyrophosphohydrolase